ncbi:MAG: zinc ribbon domain-containing protein, partial [Ktedonobacterales bacterium]
MLLRLRWLSPLDEEYTMECGTCGATLRKGARFCNTCGAVQGGSASDGAPSTPGVSAGMSEPGASGRARRPARVARGADGSDASTPARSLTAPIATDILDAAALAQAEQDAAPEAGA